MNFHSLLELFTTTLSSQWYNQREHETLLSPMFPSTFTLSWGPDLPYNFMEWNTSLKWKKFIVNQPCIRHRDIEKVWDNKHLSFFNMFVADSILWVPRKDLIKIFFDLFTQKLGFDKNKFYASYFGWGEIHGKYFEADLEAKEIWLSLWIDENKLIEFSWELGMEAFVANTVEPVWGPRAELFYDLSPDSDWTRSFNNFLELEKRWEILEFFTTVNYNMKVNYDSKTEIYTMESIEWQAIAGWFWAQRVLSILEKKSKILDISIFDKHKEIFNEYNISDNAKTSIISDHLRWITFLLHDGMAELHGQRNRSRRHLFRKYMSKLKYTLNELWQINNQKLIKQLLNDTISDLHKIHPTFHEKREYIHTNFNNIYNRINL